MLVIDFETRSRVDLPRQGQYLYAQDDSTDMLCLAMYLDEEEFLIYEWSEFPLQVREYIEKTDGLIAAFNAGFDRLIWENLAPEHLQVPLGRWYCVAAQMRVNAMPSSLANATRAVFGENRKDIRGPQLIKLLSIPQPDGEFLENDALLGEMGDYCVQDVRATVDLMQAVPLMSPGQHRDYINNEIINDDGVRVDHILATNAQHYAESESAEIALKLIKLTDGTITKHTQVGRIKDWFVYNTSQIDEVRKMMTVKEKGRKEPRLSLDKNIRARLIIAHDEHLIELPGTTREVIQLLDDGNKSSVSKFKRMLDRADSEDYRVRGAFVFAGASQTLRYASRGLQLHNFRRDCWSPVEAEQICRRMADKRTVLRDDTSVMDTLSKLLRPALIPQTSHDRFIVGDWSAIEARALPWLSNSRGGNERLAQFRAHDAGEPDSMDMYTRTQKQLNLPSRQVGKVAELALGYGGSLGAFKSMAQNYAVALPDHKIKQIVERWRERNGWAVKFWNALDEAARKAIHNHGKVFTAGRVEYRFYPDLMNGTLVCSVRGTPTIIKYPGAKVIHEETEYGPRSTITAIKANIAPAQNTKEWPQVKLWRGLLAENITQALCATLLREAINVCVEQDIAVVAHVHDEIVAEASADEAGAVAIKLRDVMEGAPSWATGLPLKAEPKILKRYGK